MAELSINPRPTGLHYITQGRTALEWGMGEIERQGGNAEHTAHCPGVLSGSETHDRSGS